MIDYGELIYITIYVNITLSACHVENLQNTTSDYDSIDIAIFIVVKYLHKVNP